MLAQTNIRLHHGISAQIINQLFSSMHCGFSHNALQNIYPKLQELRSRGETKKLVQAKLQDDKRQLTLKPVQLQCEPLKSRQLTWPSP